MPTLDPSLLNLDTLILILGMVVVAAPLCLMALLGGCSLIGWPLSEKTSSRAVEGAVVAGLFAACCVLVLMVTRGKHYVGIEIGHWTIVQDFHLSIKFVFDRLSVPFAILSFVLTGTIGAFASRYLHREPGYNRFFVLYALFLLGMVVTSLAGTIETLFAGWELVGLSSALLVAFFQDRQAPARNGLRVWVVYRVSDAALLLAAVVLHHRNGEGDFEYLTGHGDWPFGIGFISPSDALIVGLLILVAAAGKSALVPFSGWLPRAMEGPTPSSAVFYGALSVHLGAFLLLRVSPLLDASTTLSVLVVILGLVTALYAYLVASVQTDIKSALSFASLSQVGLIVAEIGLGFRYLALIHILGHACLRTLQFVRAPTLLLDYSTLENALGNRLPQQQGPWGRLTAPVRSWLYRFALERGYLDGFLDDCFANPFIRTMRWFDRLERRWTDFLSGKEAHESDLTPPYSGTFEELP